MSKPVSDDDDTKKGGQKRLLGDGDSYQKRLLKEFEDSLISEEVDSSEPEMTEYYRRWDLAWENPLLRDILEKNINIEPNIELLLENDQTDLLLALDRVLGQELPPGLSLSLHPKPVKGAYGELYKAYDKNNNAYAAKRYKKGGEAGREQERSILQYVNRADPVTRQGQTPYVMSFFGYFEDFYGGPLLLAEWIPGLTLENAFVTERSLLDLKRYFYLSFIIPQIFIGLSFLHKKGIAHRDIKPDNIMLVTPRNGENGRTVLVDLGVSCVFDDNNVARRLLDKFTCVEDRFDGKIYYQSPKIARVYYSNFKANSESIQQAPFEMRAKNDVYAAIVTVIRIMFDDLRPQEMFFEGVLNMNFKRGRDDREEMIHNLKIIAKNKFKKSREKARDAVYKKFSAIEEELQSGETYSGLFKIWEIYENLIKNLGRNIATSDAILDSAVLKHEELPYGADGSPQNLPGDEIEPIEIV
jgi:serine/threonine protein kinase